MVWASWCTGWPLYWWRDFWLYLSVWLGLRVIDNAATVKVEMPSPVINQTRQIHLFHSRK